MRRSSPARLALAGLTLTIALAAFPLAALASHDFADVPNSNPFHADISALAASGVTTGCGGGNFCPSAFVTREHMAAFMNRLGALAAGKTPVVNATKLDGLDSTQLARSDQTQHYSCAGTDMNPRLYTTAYASTSAGWRSVVSGASDFLSCAVHLPDGATVTRFAADVMDSSVDWQTDCGLTRVLSTAAEEVMAFTDDSGVTPGLTTLVVDGISAPVIDNTTYAYSAWCYLHGAAGTSLRVVKVTVTYTGAP